MKRKISNHKFVFLVLSSFFVTFCLSFTINTFSKMITKLSDVQDSKTVAKWDVSANLPDATYTIVSTDEQTYQISVTNNSEVALTYSIKITNKSQNSLVYLDGTQRTDLKNDYTFNDVGTINANDTNKTKQHTLKFVSTPDVSEYNNRQVKIEVIFKQKNPS